MFDEIEYDYWWASMQCNFCKQIKRIADIAGSTKALYEMPEEELINIEGISTGYAQEIVKRRRNWDVHEEYEKFLDMGIRFIPWYSEEYPKRLLNIKGFPFGIFVKGELPGDDVKTVGIIGARNCSQYGIMMAERFGSDLAHFGVEVVSGMAYGIDGISQQAALDGKTKTYGVLGCGVNICYPPSNRQLYERIIQNGGVISEYGIYTQAQARLFPPRNRIISALSDVLLVIEAREKSGTMITVDMALEQGKDVCVIPGRVTDPLSTGCIKLWKQGAVPVTQAEDVMYILDNDFDNKKKKVKKKSIKVSDIEKNIFEQLDVYAKSIGEISDGVKLPLSDVLNGLLNLQIMGVVKEIGTGYYVISKECVAVSEKGA